MIRVVIMDGGRTSKVGAVSRRAAGRRSNRRRRRRRCKSGDDTCAPGRVRSASRLIQRGAICETSSRDLFATVDSPAARGRRNDRVGQLIIIIISSCDVYCCFNVF